MPYYITLPDQERFCVDDLPLDRWAKIEKQTGIGWAEALSVNDKGFGVLVANAAVAVAVVAEVCDILAAEMPVLTVGTIGDVFRFELKANVPEQFVDGAPDPKASGTGPATT